MKESPKWFKYLYFGLLFLLNSGCTFSIIMTHSEGSGSDAIEEKQDADPNVAPSVTLPIKS